MRYASTRRRLDPTVPEVPVRLAVQDLIAQKTAVFGMTRTGKSNTIKTLIQAVYGMRFAGQEKVGQLILDPNGEYAHDNWQDQTQGDADTTAIQPNAIKNLWRAYTGGLFTDIVRYGLTIPDQDPYQWRLLKLDFFAPETLAMGKRILNAILEEQTDRKATYIQSFCRIGWEASPPADEDPAERTRRRRLQLFYRALLYKAGLRPGQAQEQPDILGVFNKELLDALAQGNTTEGDPGELVIEKAKASVRYPTAAHTLRHPDTLSWAGLIEALKALGTFVTNNNRLYEQFEQSYMTRSSSGQAWADDDVRALLDMFTHDYGSQRVGSAIQEQHQAGQTADFAQDIYHDLAAGRLVIVDTSMGNEELSRAQAERIAQTLFDESKKRFRQAHEALYDTRPAILIYAEEAHMLLPDQGQQDLTDPWVRIAKEGAKFKLGLVYITQEVSSIQKNILKNTVNWLIGGLNNTEEIRELTKITDFEDFASVIGRGLDQGFVRLKTKSNPYVIPVTDQ